MLILVQQFLELLPSPFHGQQINWLEEATTTLTNKTLTSPVISTIVNTGTLTLPTSTDTLVGRATTDTLTNKTLTSPVINTPTLNGSGGPLTLPPGPSTLVDTRLLKHYE